MVEAGSGTGYTVLIVDDSEFFADMTAGVLRKEHGLRTDAVNSADAAMERLADRHYDCVVSDYDMPERNGLDFFTELRKDHDVPFILLTGRGDEEVASEAIGAGVSDYLRKLQVVENQRYELLANRVRNVVGQHETQRKYELLVNNTPDHIAQVARDGTLLTVNPAMADRFETTPETLVGTGLSDLLPDDVARRRLDAGRDAIRTGETRSLQDTYGDRHFHNILVPVSGRGQHETFQIISRDITDQKHREQEVRRMNEELEVINRIVRHDIRNDMNVITGWAEMLQGHVSPEGEPYLDRVLDTSRHVIELTDITRDFVDTLTGRADVDLEPINLRSVLRNEVEKKRSTYPDATFTVKACPDTEVLANEMLSSVFRNLLNNGVQHNDTDHPTIEISADETEDTVTVRISDDGPGVPDDQKEEIFGKGEKGLESEGTGIGLYLVDFLTEQYGGEVRVEDNHPRGTTFAVTLRKP